MKLAVLCAVAAACAHSTRDARPTRPWRVIALAHPGGGVLDDNVLYEFRVAEPLDDMWLSLTELTERQICLDLHLVESGNRYGIAYTRLVEDSAKRKPLELRSPVRAVSPRLVDKSPPLVTSSKMGSIRMASAVPTGQVEHVCTNYQEDRFGHKIACNETKTVPIERTVYTDVPLRDYATTSALRWCAPNDGLVTATTPWLDVTFTDLSYDHVIKIVLTGARPGAWGGRGGRDAFTATALDARAVNRPDDRPGARPKPSSSTALVIRPVRLTDKAGKLAAELTADGSLLVDGRLYAQFKADGRVLSKDGKVTVVVDDLGTVSMSANERLTKVGSIANGTLTESTGGVLTIENGRYRYRAKGRDRRSGLRLDATTEPKLLLVIGFVLATGLRFE